ncbi:MAG: hypothetical protein P4L31_03285, partial [Candidatus Babeliales bacterium]|nr:hypothetical protein [Candidatus Babeliales bacterium]
ATKFITSMMVNITAIIMLARLYKDKNYPGDHTINYHQTLTAFAKHSGMMWANNNIKSITERNFLIPLFTYIFGAVAANLFKVANDGALFFHRIVLKTIGTTDTALLSHIQTSSDRNTLMPIAFAQLTSKIANLCIPLSTILLILFLKKDLLFSNSFAFQAFFIMTIGYLIELVVSPYERMLEIERRYILLLLSYAPYILMILSFVCFHSWITYIGLVTCVLIIHLVRLVSAFAMVYFARTRYTHIEFPIAYIIKVIIVCMPIGIFLYFILTHFAFIMPYVGALIKSK